METCRPILLTIPLNLLSSFNCITTAMDPSIATLHHSSSQLCGDIPFFLPFRSIRFFSLSCCFSSIHLSAMPQFSITFPSILRHSHVTSLPPRTCVFCGVFNVSHTTFNCLPQMFINVRVIYKHEVN